MRENLIYTLSLEWCQKLPTRIRLELCYNTLFRSMARYPGNLPWLDEFKSRKFADVRLKFLHKEWQRHSMHVSRWWRQWSVDVCVRINPNNHVLWFCQGMTVDGAYGHAVIPSQGQASPPRLDDVIHIGSDLSEGKTTIRPRTFKI